METVIQKIQRIEEANSKVAPSNEILSNLEKLLVLK